MGALFRVPIAEFDAAAGRRIALVPQGGTPLHELELDGDLVFVLGAEREGLPPEVLATHDLAELAAVVQPTWELVGKARAMELVAQEGLPSRKEGTK